MRVRITLDLTLTLNPTLHPRTFTLTLTLSLRLYRNLHLGSSAGAAGGGWEGRALNSESDHVHVSSAGGWVYSSIYYIVSVELYNAASGMKSP